MCFLPEKVESRREFFRAAARYGVLGLLTAAAVVTGRSGIRAGQSCVNRGLCRGCALVARCGLPAALSFRGSVTGGGR